MCTKFWSCAGTVLNTFSVILSLTGENCGEERGRESPWPGSCPVGVGRLPPQPLSLQGCLVQLSSNCWLSTWSILQATTRRVPCTAVLLGFPPCNLPSVVCTAALQKPSTSLFSSAFPKPVLSCHQNVLLTQILLCLCTLSFLSAIPSPSLWAALQGHA